MKQIPSFIEREAPVHDMGVLFLATWRVSVDLESDPTISFVAYLQFSTPDSVVSHILPMQDYTTIKTTKMVSLSPLILMAS